MVVGERGGRNRGHQGNQWNGDNRARNQAQQDEQGGQQGEPVVHAHMEVQEDSTDAETSVNNTI